MRTAQLRMLLPQKHLRPTATGSQHRCRKPIEISEAGAAQMHEQVGGHPGEWTLRRSFCLNRLAQLYGRMPLVTTNCSFGVMSNH